MSGNTAYLVASTVFCLFVCLFVVKFKINAVIRRDMLGCVFILDVETICRPVFGSLGA